MELDLAAEPFLLPLELCPTRAHTRLTPRGISVSLQHSCCHPHVQVLAWDLQYGTCNILCLLNLTGNNGSTNSVGIPPWSCTCILGDSLLCACLSLLANSWGGWAKTEKGEGFLSQSFSFVGYYLLLFWKVLIKIISSHNYWQSHSPKEPSKVSEFPKRWHKLQPKLPPKAQNGESHQLNQGIPEERSLWDRLLIAHCAVQQLSKPCSQLPWGVGNPTPKALPLTPLKGLFEEARSIAVRTGRICWGYPQTPLRGKNFFAFQQLQHFSIFLSAEKPLALLVSWEYGRASSTPQFLDACYRNKGLVNRKKATKTKFWALLNANLLLIKFF